MGRGYWIPDNAQKYFFCDGYYIDSNAVYKGDFEKGWNELTDFIYTKMHALDTNFKKVCDWKSKGIGDNLYVIAESNNTRVIAEDACGYVAVYVIVDEVFNKQIEKIKSKKFMERLRAVLVQKYPDSISHRLNSSHVEKVAG